MRKKKTCHYGFMKKKRKKKDISYYGFMKKKKKKKKTSVIMVL